MKKGMTLGLAVIMLAGIALAEPVDDLEFRLEDGFEKQLVGGEGFEQQINFTSDSDGKIPVEFRVAVEANSTLFEDSESLLGEEFEVSGTVESGEVDMLEYVEQKWRSGEYIIYNQTGEGPAQVREDPVQEEAEGLERLRPETTDFEEIEILRDVPRVREPGFREETPFKEIFGPNVRPAEEFNGYISIPEGDVPPTAVYEYDIAFKPVLKNDRSELVYRGNPSIETEDQSDSEYARIFALDTDYNVDISVDSNKAISPDSFEFEFGVRSVPGRSSAEMSEVGFEDGSASAETDDGSVTVNSDEASSMNLKFYDEIYLPAPEGEDAFLRGVGVEVVGEGDQEDSGTVTLSYDQEVVDEGDLQEEEIDVYFYNESTQEWTRQNVNDLSVDTDENTVTFEVDHFSLYSAFTSSTTSSGSDGDGDGRYGNIEEVNFFDEPETEPEQEQQQQDDVNNQEDNTENQDQQEEQQQQEEPEDNQQDQETEETPPPETESGENPQNDQAQGVGLAGQFFSNPSSTLLGFALLIAVAALVYYYSGRVNGGRLRDFLNSLSS